jgi:iron(III) transport system permease protein
LLSLLDFSLPSLCGVTVYSLDLFAEYSARGDARQALVHAMPVMLASALIVWFSQAAFRNAASTPRHETGIAISRTNTRWAQVVLWAGVAVLLLAPLAALFRMTTGGLSLGSAWAAVRDASWVSVRTALLAALLGIPPALAVAETLAGRGWRSHAAWLVTTLPLAIPPPLVGIGWAALATRVGWPLHGSSLLPVCAALTRFLPIAALVVLVARRRLDPLFWDAARVFQANSWSGFRNVRLPLLGRGVLAAVALVAALTLGELGATLILYQPGEPTLTVRLYNFLHYGASSHVAVLGLLLALLAALAGVAGGWLAGERRTG